MDSIPYHRQTFLQQCCITIAMIVMWPFHRVASVLHAETSSATVDKKMNPRAKAQVHMR
ncbi:MAG: hypothetical protein JW863_16580 [Chitinispirillaceae bacterium]|nr:hypothetical protein [Chitinispirillaceae bacterium]